MFNNCSAERDVASDWPSASCMYELLPKMILSEGKLIIEVTYYQTIDTLQPQINLKYI